MLFFIGIFYLINLSLASTIIEIENGKIKGEEKEDFYAFKGIFYAKAERFENPQKNTEKWEGVREFKEYGSECAQYEHFSYAFQGSEDCLSLNVFVPKSVINSKELAPVIFFIHGGAFMFGGSHFYGPETLMKHGKMILVTINYRLGILGYLSTEDDVLPGNLGLKDQVEALKWVQRNIKAFNGDKNQVTIAGYSAGGASVQLHYMSKLSKGLFKNGISQSGVATNPWVMMESGREKAHLVAAYANCPHDNHKKLVKCLKEKPVEELIIIAKNFQPFLYNPFSPFGVAVEPQHEHAFLTEHPYEILKKGNFQKLPWLLSQVKDEGCYPTGEFYYNQTILNELEDRWDEIAPFLLDFYGHTKCEKMREKTSKIIKNFYMGNKKISRENFQQFNDIVSDRLFKSDAYESIKLQSKFAPSYMYYFQFKTKAGLPEFLSNKHDEICISHGEDVFLIFTSIIRNNIPYTEDEKLMIKNLIDLWYTFATKQTPIFNDLRIEEALSDDGVKVLDINSPHEYKMTVISELFGHVDFWKKIEKSLATPGISRVNRISDEL